MLAEWDVNVRECPNAGDRRAGLQSERPVVQDQPTAKVQARQDLR